MIKPLFFYIIKWDASFFSIMYHISTCMSDKARNMWQLVETIKKTYLGTPYTRVIYTESRDIFFLIFF